MREARSLQSAALALKTGEYLWRDERASGGAVTIIVSVPLQRLYAFRGLELIGVSTISTGKPGHATPIGEFEVLQKRRYHRSNIYSNAPMPFMQRLTWDGIALHGGHNPGFPASHGCIRMPMDFARLLFGATAIGAEVAVVHDDVIAPPPPEERFVPALIAMPGALRSREFDRVSGGASFDDQHPRSMTVQEALLTAPVAELRVPSTFD
jgi:hypothetical protein